MQMLPAHVRNQAPEEDFGAVKQYKFRLHRHDNDYCLTPKDTDQPQEASMKVHFPIVVVVWATVFCVTATHAQERAGSINVCANVADNIFITDYTNCSQYYICQNKQPILQVCMNKTFFNEATQSCVYSNANCLQCNPNVLSMVALKKTCNKYVLCFAGTPLLQQCADNLQFNPGLSACDVPKTVDCAANQCSIFNNANNIVYVPSQSSCAKYFICMNGAPQNMTCVGGLQFNPACNCCDLASNSGCSIKALTSLRTAEPTVIERPHMVDINCPPQGTHSYPHNNSNQYYMCVNGKGALFTCAPGLFYDSTAKNCRELQHIFLQD